MDQRKMILSLTSLVLKQSVEQSNVQDSKNLRKNFKFKGKALLLLTFCDQKLVLIEEILTAQGTMENCS